MCPIAWSGAPGDMVGAAGIEDVRQQVVEDVADFEAFLNGEPSPSGLCTGQWRVRLLHGVPYTPDRPAPRWVARELLARVGGGALVADAADALA